MERAVAIKKLGKLLGKNFGYRINDKALSREERAAARAELTAARKEQDELTEKKNARYREILAADLEYQNLFAACKAAKERADRLASKACHCKITVGVSNSLFFHVKAEGDSWEEIIAKLEGEKQKAAA